MFEGQWDFEIQTELVIDPEYGVREEVTIIEYDFEIPETQ